MCVCYQGKPFDNIVIDKGSINIPMRSRGVKCFDHAVKLWVMGKGRNCFVPPLFL